MPTHTKVTVCRPFVSRGQLKLVLFVLIHVFEVLISGVWNNLRSMITGRYHIAPDPTPQERP